MKVLSPVEKLDENVNISSALCSTSRILYPKLAKKCKTDMLLPRRMQLKLVEERALLTKNTKTIKKEPVVSKCDLNIKLKSFFWLALLICLF